jgi:hypothetical protein
VQQRGLPLVHEEGEGGVQRRAQHHPVLDVVAPHDVRHLLREVVQLQPLVGDDADRLGDDADGLQPFRLGGRGSLGRRFCSLGRVVPIDAEFEPICEHANPQQRLGVRVAGRLNTAVVVLKKRVPHFKLSDAASHRAR